MEFKQFNNWHFLNVPRETYAISPNDCLNEDCILKGIAYHTKGLTMPGISENQHAQALKYLGHWLGDIHQPLHVSFKDDRGGNDMTVSGECSGSFHSAWDTCLLHLAVGEDVKAAADDILGTPP